MGGDDAQYQAEVGEADATLGLGAQFLEVVLHSCVFPEVVLEEANVDDVEKERYQQGNCHDVTANLAQRIVLIFLLHCHRHNQDEPGDDFSQTGEGTEGRRYDGGWQGYLRSDDSDDENCQTDGDG